MADTLSDIDSLLKLTPSIYKEDTTKIMLSILTVYDKMSVENKEKYFDDAFINNLIIKLDLDTQYKFEEFLSCVIGSHHPLRTHFYNFLKRHQIIHDAVVNRQLNVILHSVRRMKENINSIYKEDKCYICHMPIHKNIFGIKDLCLLSCPTFLILPASAKLEIVRTFNVCIYCLSLEHSSINCRLVHKCRTCDLNHNVNLCTKGLPF